MIQRLTFTVLIAAALPLANAATLQVPKDYTTIQRAIFAADAGDTIEIEPGQFTEHIWISKPLTLKGAGMGKTTLVGPRREESVIFGDGEGPIVVRDLSLGHTSDDQPDAYAEVAKFLSAEVIVRDIEVTRSSHHGLEFESCRRATIQNVSIKNTENYGIHLRYCKEFLVESVTADAVLTNYFIQVQSSVGRIKNVSDAEPSDGFINVWGASKVEFEAVDPKLKELMEIGEYDDSPGEGEFELTPEDAAEQAAQMKKYEAERKRLQAVVQSLTRKLQKEGPRGATLEQHSTALQNYINNLLRETDQIGQFITSEFAAFNQQHGAAALDTLISSLPFKEDEYHKTVQQFYDYHLPKPLVSALAEHRARSAIKSTFELTTVLARWRQIEGSSSPAEAGSAFYDMARAVSDKAETSSPEETKILKAALLREVAPFVEKQGFPSLDELLSRLTQTALPILTAQDVRSQLTPEQKRAFAKFLVQ